MVKSEYGNISFGFGLENEDLEGSSEEERIMNKFRETVSKLNPFYPSLITIYQNWMMLVVLMD